jgi:hypothetical protein
LENRLLDQFNNVISTQWLKQESVEDYGPLTHRELFEIAYHTCNDIGTRCIWVKLSPEEQGGSRAILYSKDKLFTEIESLIDNLKITHYFNEDGNGDRLSEKFCPIIETRKEKFAQKDKKWKEQMLKIILVERKIDEAANLVMTKDINRKVYFAIGDARESAAVVPIFMEAEGSNLVQLALNKWMTTAQNLPPEESFPEDKAPGLLRNLMQIKKWILNLVSSQLDKE